MRWTEDDYLRRVYTISLAYVDYGNDNNKDHIGRDDRCTNLEITKGATVVNRRKVASQTLTGMVEKKNISQAVAR